MRQVGEPSVEEILESIKKVIARDNRVGAAEERRVRETRGLPQNEAEDRDDGILDLATSGEFIDELDDDSDDESQPDSAEAGGPLITETSRSSMRDSLVALAMLAEPGAQPRIVRSGETSLEDLTRELLRPALAEWLDKNLPPMVERLVAAEISRIVGKKG